MTTTSLAAIGAIWIRGEKLKSRIHSFLSGKGISVTAAELDNLLKVHHVLAVKIQAHQNGHCEIKEKFIAVANSRTGPSQPDYFVHLYQTDTGSAPVHAWRVK